MLKKFLLQFLRPIVYCMIPTYIAVTIFCQLPNWLAGNFEHGLWGIALYVLACLISIVYLIRFNKGNKVFAVNSIEIRFLTIIFYIFLMAVGQWLFYSCFNHYTNNIHGEGTLKLPLYFIFIPDERVFLATALVHASVAIWYAIKLAHK